MFGSGISSAMAAREARRNREFQERMFRNRYQIQTEDMKKAGINPILAAVGGPGGVPSGSAASVHDMGQSMAAGGKAFGLMLKENKLKQEQITDAKWMARRSRLFTQLYEKGWHNLEKQYGKGAATALFLKAQGFGDWESAGAAGIGEAFEHGPTPIKDLVDEVRDVKTTAKQVEQADYGGWAGRKKAITETDKTLKKFEDWLWGTGRKMGRTGNR